KWCYFGVGGFDPVGEEVALISLIPEITVKVGISDFFDWLDIIDGIDGRIVIVHVNPNLLECSLCEQESLDSRQCCTGRIISLFDQRKLFTLTLIQPPFHGIRFS